MPTVPTLVIYVSTPEVTLCSVSFRPQCIDTDRGDRAARALASGAGCRQAGA